MTPSFASEAIAEAAEPAANTQLGAIRFVSIGGCAEEMISSRLAQ